jgi:xanthine dehydrogenase accessory factor
VSDLFSIAPCLSRFKEPWVLVTLVACHGSTYRKPGARLLVTNQGTSGLMSGGCLEAEIARLCQPLLAGEQRLLRIELDTRQFLGCDGRLTLMAETISNEFFARVESFGAERRSGYCSTPLAESDPTGSFLCDVENEDDRFFQALAPPRRLLAFGSGPDVPPLLQMASLVGWDSSQVVLGSDPQAVQVSSALAWSPEMGWPRLKLDEQTAVVVMHHQFGRDLETLYSLWESPVRYLGLLGSRRRRDELLAHLIERDIDLESRPLYAPVGMKLGAEGPSEIALEICAEVQRVFSGDPSN